jgi:MarR family transcriptional regulator, temperature-dependent positive regulator of motility
MPASQAQDGTAYLLAIAGAAARRRWAEMLAHLDVTPTQFKAIMTLGEAGSLGQRQLAELIGVDPRNCGPIVDSLVDRDLLARETDSNDRRRRLLCLTAKGEQLARDLEFVNAQTESNLLSSLSPAEQAALRRTLTVIIQSAEDQA